MEKESSNYINNHIEAINAVETKLNMPETPEEKLKRRSLSKESSLRLSQRLDSQSRRINKLQDKLAQILSNHEHYLKIRLPAVLKREEARTCYSQELYQARLLLKSLNKQRFVFLSNSKDKEKRTQRFIGMFTHVELQRLRRLLNVDHSFEYMLYRKDGYEKLKNKHILMLDEKEKRKLEYLLKKSLDKI